MDQVVRRALTGGWIASLAGVVLSASLPLFAKALAYGLRDSGRSPTLFAGLPLPELNATTGWIVMYIAAVMCAASAIAVAALQSGSLLAVPLVLYLFLIQVTRRLYETLRVHRRSVGPLNPLVWIGGISFYIMAGMSFILESTVASPSRLRFLTAAMAFLAASAVQTHAHFALASVQPIRGKYGVPRGGLFEYVCCPHYTAEIVIYASLLALCPGRLVLLCFLLVVGNLSVSALQTQEWYAETFPVDALPLRKAILPFFL
jgi:3-oxo-5-alpha-steroid 4-dehydrogenase